MIKKNTLLLVCIILLGAGLALYLAGFALGARVIGVGFSNQGFQIHSLRNASNGSDLVYVEQNITLEDFSSIDVQLDYAIVTLMPSDHFGLDTRTMEDSQLTYDIVNGCLRLRERASGISIFGGFNFTLFGSSSINTTYTEPNRITVYFPADTKLTSVSGNCNGTEITMYDVTADTMDISLDFGNLTIENIEAVSGTFNLNSGNVLVKEGSFDTLFMQNDFGNIELRQVNIDQTSDITMNSGTFTLQDTQCDQFNFSGSFDTVNINTLSAASVKMQLDSGDVSLDQLTSDSMEISNNFGNIDLRQVNVGQTVDVTMDSGTFTLKETQCDRFDFSGSFITVNINTLSAASLKMQMDSGKAKLEQLTSDAIEISNNFGNVDLKLTQSLELYRYDVSTEFGKIIIGGSDVGTSYRTLFGMEDTDKWIQIHSDSCDVSIESSK